MSASASPKVHRVRFKDPLAWLSACVFVASCAESPTGNGTPPQDAAADTAPVDIVLAETSVDVPPDLGERDAGAVDVMHVSDVMDVSDATDAPTPDRMDSAAPDVVDARVVDVSDVRIVDAPDVAAVPDGGVRGALRFDLPEEVSRLPTSYALVHDLNGDGRLDALLTERFSPVGMLQYTFALAQPSGDYTPGTRFGVNGTAASLDYGDFDADRRTDVIVRVASATMPNTYIFRGRGDGTFAPVETLTFTGNLIADFNADGRTDIVQYVGSSSAIVQLRQADGTFRALPSFFLPTTLVVAGDFDGDGRPDLFTGTTVLRGLGDGRFATGQTVACTACRNASRTLVGRFNGDARDDLIVVDTENVSVLLGQADGTLTMSVNLAVYHPEQLGAGDLDADGNLDLVFYAQPLAVTSNDQLALFYGDGAGRFPDQRSYQNTRWSSVRPLVADVDQDGVRDVVVDGRYVAQGRGMRRIRAPELSTFAFTDSNGTYSIAALAGRAPLDLIVPTMTASFRSWRFQSDRRLGPMATCDGPGTGIYRGVRDLTGDGRPEVFSLSASAISVWPSMGGCMYGTERRSTVTSYTHVFVDANRDGLLDLVHTTMGGVGVSLATAPGDFAASVVSPLRGSFEYLAAGDWNRDGSIDALVIDNSARTITVLQGDASRRLTTSQTFMSTATEVWFPTPGDVDGDGDMDVLVSNNTAHQLEILRNDGTGRFARETLMAIDSLTQMSVADLDNDRRLEVLVADNQLQMSVLRVDGAGATRLLRLAIPRGAAPYDVDGDGDLDLVQVGRYTGRAFVGVANNRSID
jgi:hypothetical protein